ncbi:MAG: serine O-acetyltransferase [Campylobacteraceae bacterium 4484_166]|nr:MAG: serine O-acetyltransferase [Campylobacteraceae bacterium 4484_166]
MSLWQKIKEDFGLPKKNDPALNSNFEVFFNYPGVWAIFYYRIANILYKKNFTKLARFISGISQIFTNIDIHPGCNIGRRVFIDHGFGVVIGQTSVIHDDVLIYQGVTLGGVSLSHGKRHPTIQSFTTIGAGAKILGNITVGKHAKIGANSVVVGDVKANCTAIGVPAKVVREKRSSKKDEISLDHHILPDVSKEMFTYLIKRVAILEHAIKEQENIDVSKEDKELEHIYKKFLSVMKQ